MTARTDTRPPRDVGSERRQSSGPHREPGRSPSAKTAEIVAAAVAASRGAQGLPPTVRDPAVLAHLARLLATHNRRPPQPRATPAGNPRNAHRRSA
jgi:hypothetical protein